jgi:hypothetical protein
MLSLPLNMISNQILLRWVMNSLQKVPAGFVQVVNASRTQGFQEREYLLSVLNTLR